MSRARAETGFLFGLEDPDQEARAALEAAEEAEARAEEAARAPPRAFRRISDPEEWADYWSEELVTLYHETIDRCESYGWAIMDKCTFAAFVQFAFAHSSRRPPAA